MSTAVLIRSHSFQLQIGLQIEDEVWTRLRQRLSLAWAVLLFLMGVWILSSALADPLTQLAWLPFGLLTLTYGEVRLLTYLMYIQANPQSNQRRL
jgi:intracellular septation protein A